MNTLCYLAPTIPLPGKPLHSGFLGGILDLGSRLRVDWANTSGSIPARPEWTCSSKNPWTCTPSSPWQFLWTTAWGQDTRGKLRVIPPLHLWPQFPALLGLPARVGLPRPCPQMHRPLWSSQAAWACQANSRGALPQDRRRWVPVMWPTRSLWITPCCAAITQDQLGTAKCWVSVRSVTLSASNCHWLPEWIQPLHPPYQHPLTFLGCPSSITTSVRCLARRRHSPCPPPSAPDLWLCYRAIYQDIPSSKSAMQLVLSVEGDHGTVHRKVPNCITKYSNDEVQCKIPSLIHLLPWYKQGQRQYVALSWKKEDWRGSR